MTGGGRDETQNVFSFLVLALMVFASMVHSYWAVTRAGAAKQPSVTPPFLKSQNAEEVNYKRGNLLIGVDNLGRTIAALDEEAPDGIVDFFFLFTAETRLAESDPRRVRNVVLRIEHQQALFRSDSERFIAQYVLRDLSVDPLDVPDGFDFEGSDRGIEMVRVPASGLKVAMSTLSTRDVSIGGWPQFFIRDILSESPGNDAFAGDGGSCSTSGPTSSPSSTLLQGPFCDGQCDAGGPGSTHCSIGGCSGAPSECSVCCTFTHYACCKCWGLLVLYANCRCCISQ
jgi:hypothetical protein